MSEVPHPSDPIHGLVHSMLQDLGEDPQRQGIVDTPKRVAKSLRFLLGGEQQSLEEVVNGAVFDEEVDEMVLVHDIEFYSMCEHHMLPFFGRMHVAYLPKGRIIGLSKIPRIVDMFARRLQVQERLTVQVAEALQEVLDPKGVAVVSEASHLCMMMRGVSKQASRATASCMLGGFRSHAQTRNEFLNLVGNSTRS